MNYPEIIRSIRKRQFAPVYFICGEEAWYIDQITLALEKHVLSENEKSFNLSIFYGKDADVLNILSTAKRYPMMADHQLVIVREAQGLKGIEKMMSYLQQPLQSTVLVFAYKYGKPDGRTEFGKRVKELTLFFEAKELRENQMVAWIEEYVAEKSRKIEPRAAALLADYLGTDLERVSQQIDKISLLVAEGETLDLKVVETNTGISREFNVFELSAALGRKDIYKSNLILQNLEGSKDAPPVLIMGTLISYFSKLLVLHGMRGENEAAMASAIGGSPWFLKEYIQACRNFKPASLVKIMGRLRTADLRLKGVDSPADLKSADILKELLYFILHD